MILSKMGIDKFLDELASSSPAPGGGSVAALSGAIGCALIEMVCNLTIGKKKYLDVEEEVKFLRQQSNDLRKQFLEKMEEDTLAFNDVMAAMKLPKETEEQKSDRSRELDQATRKATQIPFEVVELSVKGIQYVKRIVAIGNTNSLSDAAGASLCLRIAAEEAGWNVYINLPGISDRSLSQTYLEETKKRVELIIEDVKAITKTVQTKILG